MTTAERFWAKVDRSGECWVWIGWRTSGGYGGFDLTEPEAGGHIPAHRFAYEQEVGPIPPGLELDHLCRNTACVRPDHLEAVTHRENVLRGNGITAQAARRTHCPRGHAYDYRTKAGDRRCRTCDRAIEERRPPRVHSRKESA